MRPLITFVPLLKAFRHFGVSKSKGYDLIKDGLLPPAIRISIKKSALTDTEIEEINTAIIAGKSEDERKALVVKIIAARKAGGA